MQVQRITVIGTGTMGNGIAGQAALKGFDVVLYDIDAERVAAALGQIGKTYDKGVARGKVSADDAEAGRGRLSSSDDLISAVKDADLVVEAVPERMSLKQEIFATLERETQGHTILATNTSSLSISEIASATGCADRVVGMHFFNPVAVMPLVELVRGRETSDEVLAEARRVAEQMGKECITVTDSPGFATSRLGICLGNEAMRMFEEGVASAEDIDKAMTLGYRHPIGPLALTDLVGLDVRLAISEHLHRELGTDTFKAPEILRKMVSEGKLGRKTGEGFYTYS